MKGVVYYSTTGKIFNIVWGEEKGDQSLGVPFIEIDVPMGAVISEVDLSAEPPKIVFTKYPEDDYDVLNKKVEQNTTELSTAQADIRTQTAELSTTNEAITDLELAIASLYEGSLGT